MCTRRLFFAVCFYMKFHTDPTGMPRVFPSEHAHLRRGLAALDPSISYPSAPRRLPVPETVLMSLLHRTQAPQYILAHAAAAALGLSS